MKNETINTYTEITPLDALKLLVENEGNPVEGLVFSDDHNHWMDHGKLCAIYRTQDSPFRSVSKWWNHCAKVTEIDPCKAPEGCPELEPWMAYVGESDELRDWGQCGAFLLNYGHRWDVCIRSAPKYTKESHQWCVDVRTEWAQEHFPEHCRIRNYQEPDVFDLWIKKRFSKPWSNTSCYPCSGEMLRRLYELGQANPKTI